MVGKINFVISLPRGNPVGGGGSGFLSAIRPVTVEIEIYRDV
jgi:hypothetical protein